MSHQPPILAVRMLSWRLSPEWRDFVLGDLEEEFRARADRVGAGRPALVLAPGAPLPDRAAARLIPFSS